jgi:hypothetical protein
MAGRLLSSLGAVGLLVAGCGADPSDDPASPPQAGNSSAADAVDMASSEMPGGEAAEVFNGVIVAYDQTLVPVKYRKAGDLAVVGGDMVIGTHAEMQQRMSLLNDLRDNVLANEGTLPQRTAMGRLALNAEARGEKLLDPANQAMVIRILGWGTLDPVWPYREVGFEFDPSIPPGPRRDTILKGIDLWNAQAPTKLTPVSRLDPSLRARQVTITFVDHKDPDDLRSCMSWVGYHPDGGQQKLYLNPLCMPGNVAHELGHAFGLHHEHQRSDRAAFMKVNAGAPNDTSYYGILKGRALSPHDLCSIMHYKAGLTRPPWFTVTASGAAALKACVGGLRPECQGRTADDQVGQRCQLSPSDVQSLRMLYP